MVFVILLTLPPTSTTLATALRAASQTAYHNITLHIMNLINRFGFLDLSWELGGMDV